jgi:NAD(P)H-quinone oxidoreductase subunit 5
VVWVFNAAVVHLLLHGFYKAYLFLSAGNRAFETAKPTPIKIKPVQAVIVLFFGILGAFLFAYLTGKELN